MGSMRSIGAGDLHRECITNVRRLVRLRAALKAFRPDVVLAFTTEANVVAVWSALGLGVPIVVSERNQPDRPGLGLFTRAARRVSYPLAAALVVQTEAIAAWARSRFGASVHVLPNPVRLASWGDAPRRQRKKKQIVAAGRLVPQKGFDVLIASFAELAPAFPAWTLVIYGEGGERENSRSAGEAVLARRGDHAARHSQGYGRRLCRGRFIRAAVAL